MYCDGLPADNYSCYILGTLAGPELAELDSHLERGCTRCKSELVSTRKLWYAFGSATPSAKPSRGLRDRVIASVGQPLRLAWWKPVVALATIALALFVGAQINRRVPQPVVAVLPTAPPIIIAPSASSNNLLPAPSPAPAPVVIVREKDNGSLLAQVASTEQNLARQKELLAAAERDRDELNRKYQAALAQPKPDNSATERQLTAAQLRTQQLEHDVSEYRALLEKARDRPAASQTATLLADPNLRLVRLRGLGIGSEAEAHALVSSGSQVIFFASRLPALPQGRAYQLWLIRDSAPAIVSAGIFQPDARKSAVVQFKSVAFTSSISTIAVTDEPEGGSATPTGHKLLIGS